MTSVFDFYMKYSIACSHLFTVYSETYQSTDWLIIRLIDWLVFNGTFSINRLYHAFDKNAADKKLNWIEIRIEINEKLKLLHAGNTYNKAL